MPNLLFLFSKNAFSKILSKFNKFEETYFLNCSEETTTEIANITRDKSRRNNLILSRIDHNVYKLSERDKGNNNMFSWLFKS